MFSTFGSSDLWLDHFILHMNEKLSSTFEQIPECVHGSSANDKKKKRKKSLNK